MLNWNNLKTTCTVYYAKVVFFYSVEEEHVSEGDNSMVNLIFIIIFMILRNSKKIFPCFHRVIQTQVEVLKKWEIAVETQAWQTSVSIVMSRFPQTYISI